MSVERRHGKADMKVQMGPDWIGFHDGIRWKCIRCMRCCRTDWAINLTWTEYDRLKADPRAIDLEIDKVAVDPDTGGSHPYFVIDGSCPLLEEGSRSCGIYPDWPYTCATYPFLMMPDGRLLIHRDCRGIGRGEAVGEEEMIKRIIQERKKAGMVP